MGADFTPSESLGHWAARLSWAARGALERRLKPLGVTPPMMAALLAIHAGAERGADVAEHMGVDAAAVTRLMDRLHEAGLIGRCDMEGDRRSRKLSLSPQALALLPKLQKAAAELDQRLAEGLNGAQKKELMQTLKRLSEKADAL